MKVDRQLSKITHGHRNYTKMRHEFISLYKYALRKVYKQNHFTDVFVETLNAMSYTHGG